MRKPEPTRVTKPAPPAKKNKKSFSIISIIVLCLICGFSLGWYLDLTKSKSIVLKRYKKEVKQEIENKKHSVQIKDTSSMPFINPISFLYSRVPMQFDELKSFKPQVYHYILEACKDNSVEIVSVYFRDLNNGLWFGINEREKFSPASLYKVPVLIAILKKAQSDSSILKEKIVYVESDNETVLLRKEGIDMPRTKMLPLHEYSVEELIHHMIVYSDNDATVMLIDKMSHDYLRQVKKDLGFIDPLNLTAESNYITVKAYSTFFRVLFNASYLNKKYSNMALEILSRAEYPYGIRAAIPDRIVISHKFGERDHFTSPYHAQIRQLHRVAIVYYPWKPFLLNIMTKGDDRVKLQKVIQDIAEIIYTEVDRQVRLMPKNNLDKDKERDED